MLLFSHLSHIYQQTYALKDLNLHLPQHTLTAIIGPNGAGKSTFLKIIAGLLKPTQGHFSCQSKLNLAYLPQQSSLDKTFPLTVKDVVAMGLWPQIGMIQSVTSSQNRALEQAIQTVGLKGLEHHNLHTLSGGQFQRLLFARMMVQDADILLLDEPFAAVDEPTTTDLLGLLKQWHHQGKTILAVMHNVNLVRQYFPHTLILAKEVVAYGPTASVLTRDSLLRAHLREGLG